MIKFLRLGTRRLRVRLTAWYIFLLALTLILFSSYLYLQLENNLLENLDAALQVTSSQISNNLITMNGYPSFNKNPEVKADFQRLERAELAGRLLSLTGEVWDGFGSYQEIPIKIPLSAGFMDLKNSQTRWRVYNQSLSTANNENAWLQIAESLAPVDRASEHLLTLMLLSFPLVLIIAGVGGWFLADRALQPIDKIIRTATKISANDFTQRIDYQGPADEVGRLTITIDRMLDRLQAAFEHERRFTADAAHELRTPLTIIKGRIGVSLSRSRPEDEYVKTLQDLETEADRLIRLTNGLLYLSRLEQQQQQPGFLEAVDLTNLLTALVEQIQPLAISKEIVLEENIAPDLVILGNSDYLTNLFLNLLDNALKYTWTQGKVIVRAWRESQYLRVTVADTGIGIDAEYLPYIFDRFYRVEKARSRHTGGAGLGLAIAQEIAKLHGGILTAQNHHPKGTIFIFTIPK